MKKPLPLLLALLSAQALAGAGPTPSPQSNVVRTTTALADGGNPIWYVDVRGNDSNTCTKPFTDGGSDGPCRQPQGAINKIPKGLRHVASVIVDAGTYSCFYVQGFDCDVGSQADVDAGIGLIVDGRGSFVNSTLATGTSTGTATSSTAGSGATYGTLTHTGQTWTTDDLTGRFVTAGGTTRLISSNTADTLTVVGTWTSPGAVPYTIQDPTVVINTTCPSPASPFSAALPSQGGAIVFSGNSCAVRTDAMGVAGMRITNTQGAGILSNSGGSFRAFQMQVRTSGSASAGFEMSPAYQSNSLPSGGMNIVDSDFVSSSVNDYVRFPNVSSTTTLTRVLVRGGNRGIGTFGYGQITFSTVELRNQSQYAISVGNGISGLAVGMTGIRITCASTSANGVLVGGLSTPLTFQGPGFASVSSMNTSGCGAAFIVNGPLAALDVSTLSGSANTVFQVQGGATAVFAGASMTATGSVQDVLLDGTPYSAAGITAGAAGCVTSFSVSGASVFGAGSRTCKR